MENGTRIINMARMYNHEDVCLNVNSISAMSDGLGDFVVVRRCINNVSGVTFT